MPESRDKPLTTFFLTVFHSYQGSLWSAFLKRVECELIFKIVMSHTKMLTDDI